MSFLLANGNFQLPAGGPVAGGVLTLTLSNPSATVIATGGAATLSYAFTLDTNGNLPAGSTVLGNNELTPAGTFYTASLVTSGGTPVTLANGFWVVGPSALYAGSLFPDVNVYPALSISGVVPGSLELTGSTGLPAATTTNLWMAGNFGSPIVGKIYLGDGTGWELDFAKRVGSVDTTLFQFKDSGQLIAVGNITGKLGAASGAGLTLSNGSGLAYIDGSAGTAGQGGYVNFTNDASNITGYSCWITNNAFFNGTSWIQPRGVGTSSTGLAVSNHKSFSFNFAAAGGTNNAAITWTEWANLSSGGFNLKTGQYLLNGVQISASNLSNGVTGSGAVVLAASPTLTGTTSVATLKATATTGGGGSAAVVQVQAASPAVALEATGQAVDQKWWDMIVSTTSFLMRAVNDANNSATSWLTAVRGTGIAVSSVTIGQDAWGGFLSIAAQDGVNEGGELHLLGAGANTTAIIDTQSGLVRIFGGAASPTTFDLATGNIVTSGTVSSNGAVVGNSLATVTFSATPTFNAAAFNSFKITLTANVTSSTLSGAGLGQILIFEIIQDATGGRTFVWPTNVKNAGSPEPTANSISVQAFIFDGTNAYPIGPMTVN